MSAYLIIQIEEILNQSLYEEYILKTKPIIKRFVGSYTVTSDKITLFSGDWSPLKAIMIHFRKAKQSDVLYIRILIKTILDDNGIIVNRKKIDEDLSDLDLYYFNRNGWFEVIESDDQIIGCYGIFMINHSTCELRKMYVDQFFQGQGLGKQIMNKAIEKANMFGDSIIILETNKLLHKAIHLYEKYGFIPCSTTHLSSKCDFAMQKIL